MSLIPSFAKAPQWKIKGSGGDIEFSSMLEFSAQAHTTLPIEPIEKGSFATYNRVLEPIVIRAKLAKKGTKSDQQKLVDTLKKYKDGVEKCTVVTPETVYKDYCLEGYEVRRDNRTGHNVIIVDVEFHEIREVATQQTTTAVDEPEPITEESSADGGMVDDEDVGMTQGSPATEAEEAAAESGGEQTSTLYDILT